jgi:hypothetical protein
MMAEQQVGPELTELPDEVCTNCGARSDEWSDPVTKEGDRYCCPDCAAGKACSCSMTTPSL